MSAATGSPPLEGELIMVPLVSEEYLDTIRSEYERFAARHGADRILILNRYPSGTSGLEDELAKAVRTVERPRVDILSRHAERVVERDEPAPETFDRSRRPVLVREFLAEHEWETNYLQEAATRDGFHADFRRFMITASHQRQPASIEDPILTDLYDAVIEYHDFCEAKLPDRYDLDRGFLDRAKVISAAVDRLDDPDIGDEVRDEFDAVLALEFEEFGKESRAYLAKLSRDKELVAVGQDDSAVRRPFSETGRIEESVPAMRLESAGSATPTTPLQTLSAYLGTGTESTGDLSNVALRIHAHTFRDHVRAIAREIERLHRENEYQYDDIAVVLRDSNAPIEETNDILRTRGLPTTSATVRGLEHDPASRELLAVSRWMASTECEADVDADRAHATLVSRVSRSRPDRGATELVDGALDAAANAPDVHAGLWRWIVHSGMKERIASSAEPIEARIQFDHVTDLATLVEFISHEVVQGDWERVVEEFEDEFESETVDRVSEDLDTVGGAIRVDAARTVKTLDFDVVFLVGVVEGEYPTDPQFGSLIPERRLRRLPAYPTVTAPTTKDVRGTFGPATADGSGREPKDSLNAYYGEISRRMLAIGVGAADDGVYFCTYEQERGLGRRRRPSRFLSELEEQFGPLREVDTTAHRGRDPETFALTSVEDAVDRIRQGAIRDDPVAMDRIEEKFGAVQTILERTDDPDLRRALEAQTDFARGRVRRD